MTATKPSRAHSRAHSRAQQPLIGDPIPLLAAIVRHALGIAQRNEPPAWRCNPRGPSSLHQARQAFIRLLLAILTGRMAFGLCLSVSLSVCLSTRTRHLSTWQQSPNQDASICLILQGTLRIDLYGAIFQETLTAVRGPRSHGPQFTSKPLKAYVSLSLSLCVCQVPTDRGLGLRTYTRYLHTTGAALHLDCMQLIAWLPLLVPKLFRSNP